MREVTISREPHRLSASLSSKIAAIGRRFERARTSDIAILPEEADALVADIRAMVGEARSLEESKSDPFAANSRVAFELVCQTEDELKVVRHVLSGMTPVPVDGAAALARTHFAAARALLEKAERVFVGEAKS